MQQVVLETLEIVQALLVPVIIPLLSLVIGGAAKQHSDLVKLNKTEKAVDDVAPVVMDKIKNGEMLNMTRNEVLKHVVAGAAAVRGTKLGKKLERKAFARAEALLVNVLPKK
jgi:hypothetical protein